MYDIVFEHDDFLVVCKHQGVCVHTEDDKIGLIVQIRQDLNNDALYPVHRLDKVTSGLMLCAKTQAAASELSQLFQHRLIEKYYLAMSDKKPKKKQGLITGDMERGRRGSWKLCHTKVNPAVTQFFSYSLGKGKRLFILKPKTGKTHQLRVALKSIGSPIIGDRLYGHSDSYSDSHSTETCNESLLGILLHASVLSFSYQGEAYRYVNLPEHWQLSEAVENDDSAECIRAALSQPWGLPWPVVGK